MGMSFQSEITPFPGLLMVNIGHLNFGQFFKFEHNSLLGHAHSFLVTFSLQHTRVVAVLMRLVHQGRYAWLILGNIQTIL